MSDVLLNTVILTVCYLFVTIALMVAAVWVYKLKVEIRELRQRNTERLTPSAAKGKDDHKLGDKECTHGG